jgi:hypothetical protein
MAAASNTSYSSTGPYISLILSSIYHSMAYSTLSAIFNIIKNAEQTQLYQIIIDENLDLIGIILDLIKLVASLFPQYPISSNPKTQPYHLISSLHFL